MTRMDKAVLLIVGFCVGNIFQIYIREYNPPLTVQHPTLETVAAMTPGNLMKYTELKLGTHVPKDSVYWTATEGHFRLTDRPGEIIYSPPPRTLWHPDSCSVRLEVVK